MPTLSTDHSLKAMDISAKGLGRRCHNSSILAAACAGVFLIAMISMLGDNQGNNDNQDGHIRSKVESTKSTLQNTAFPQILLEKVQVYSQRNQTDFKNEIGVIPSFWNASSADQCTRHHKPGTSSLSSDPCFWGPCYPTAHDVDWNQTLVNGIKLTYENIPKMDDGRLSDLSGLCRPSFLIIGQGKCGTSSLYHYLTEHPQVVPASKKQIHYFKYYRARGMKWYLTHFPTTESFLGHGALVTGEASPGYLPYPDVVDAIADDMMGPKIICIGRDPLERTYSSYRYNYVEPALKKMRKGGVTGIKRHQNDSYYEQFLFPFEDMLKAELQVLRPCLDSSDGDGVVRAKKRFYTPFKTEYDRRESLGLDPLVDIDGECYGKFFKAKVPRKQWEKLAEKHPEKFLAVPNIHLSQAMIGRSLYTYPLEWWYAKFPKDDIFFLCTEEMKDLSGEPVNNVAQFLGLKSYDFSTIVSSGVYNAAGHQGYDKVTSWEEIEQEEENHTATAGKSDVPEIPLSAEFRQELLDFFRPHNERLFELVGRRCNWADK